MEGEEWRDRGEKRERGREEAWEGGTMDTPNFFRHDCVPAATVLARHALSTPTTKKTSR